MNMRISALVPTDHLLLALEPKAARKTLQEMLSLLLEPGSQLAEAAVDRLIALRRDELLELVVGQDSHGVVEKILSGDAELEAAREDMRRLSAAAAALADSTGDGAGNGEA